MAHATRVCEEMMPEEEPYAAVAETHGAVIFFAGDRVYKMKKPVRFEFFDFSTPELRRRALVRELELNRRLAPDVYLDVAELVGAGGDLLEPVLVMRRMPDVRRLATLVRRGADVRDCVREVARAVATFHAAAETSDEITARGSLEAVRGDWVNNLDEMASAAGHVLDPTRLRAVRDLAFRYLDGRCDLFEQRGAAGLIRDGHGDLLATDIFCLDDGPRILDCIEFNDEFRWSDVLADVAFLVMDLERLGARGAAEDFLSFYCEFSAETHPRSLADLYVAYRALVRSKVAYLRHTQGDEASAEEARFLLDLCIGRLEAAQMHVVLVGGAPGTGKSTLATGLSDRLGWALLRSDEVRKDLVGIGHTERAAADYQAGIYEPSMTEATYRELLDRARRLLGRGESVILDASWTRAEHRQQAAEVAARAVADVSHVRCDVPASVAAARLERRQASAEGVSDAGPGVADVLRSAADPWPEAIGIDTGLPPEAALDAALEVVAPAGWPS